MARWDAIFDPTNPFARTGLSLEVRHALDYLEAAKADTGVDVVVTSTTDHPVFAASGSRSRHRWPGTDGEGLGLDCRLRRRGLLIHGSVFELLTPVEHLLHELIYAGAAYNVRAGHRVDLYAAADHRDHVHLSVPVGTFLTYRGTPRPTLPPLEEDAVPTVVARAQGGAIVVAPDGGVFTIDPAPFLGSLPGVGVIPNEPIVGGAWTPSGAGYWLVGRDGGLFAFGDAPAIDPTGQVFPHLAGRPVVGVAAVDAGTVDVVAFDRSNDGTPYDTYRAGA